MRRNVIVATVVLSVVGVASAEAAILCEKKSGAVFIRTACKNKEMQVDLAAFGAVGPKGDKGDTGSPGPFPATLPSGKTLTGLYRADTYVIITTAAARVQFSSHRESGSRTLSRLLPHSTWFLLGDPQPPPVLGPQRTPKPHLVTCASTQPRAEHPRVCTSQSPTCAEQSVGLAFLSICLPCRQGPKGHGQSRLHKGWTRTDLSGRADGSVQREVRLHRSAHALPARGRVGPHPRTRGRDRAAAGRAVGGPTLPA